MNRQQLIDAACAAEELFGVDECERYAEEIRRRAEWDPIFPPARPVTWRID